MLYAKKDEKQLDINLFKEPTAEYRGAPFWSWNCALDESEVIEQVSMFKRMGFGGAHAHCRSGLDTPYLSDKFNSCVVAAAEAARKEDMLLYLYDEDRWPSGNAGGMATKDKRFAARYLLFTVHKSKTPPKVADDGTLTEGKLLLARYKVSAVAGRLLGYKRLSNTENPVGIVWHAYLTTEKPRSFLNNEPYLNTLDKAAVDRFVEITYGAYEKTVREHFGATIRTMFTDEPQVHMYKKYVCPYPYQSKDRAWTDDFDATFTKVYGYSILDRLPELFWATRDGNREVRQHYFDHLAERFASAFADNLGGRCREMGISLTGHLMEEPRLVSQTRSSGEAMRQYRCFDIPGIDMLCARHEFTTAKQAQSAVRQYGREGMLSELYGVSRWDNSFANYKLSADWQAALGVTLRVPHLSHMSLKGIAKRDYPASMFYHSPWWEQYKYIEDHFARVNTALTRGKPVAQIAVIHPIESFWLKCGGMSMVRGIKMEKEFAQITELLLKAGFDFDYICESTFPELTKEGGYPLKVGEMEYKTVIVPDCLSLRSTTIERLSAFRNAGGRVIFAGGIPEYSDGKKSDAAAKLAKDCERLPFSKDEIIGALEEERLYGIYENGRLSQETVCQLREDNGGLWLFVARVAKNTISVSEKAKKRTITVCVKGEWQASLWDTISGEVFGLKSVKENGFTFVTVDVYNHDSLLLRFDKTGAPWASGNLPKFTTTVTAGDSVNYTLGEPNVLLLDNAYFALDNNRYSLRPCELLRLDNICRKRLGLPLRKGRECQPWAAEKIPPKNTLNLKFVINSQTEVAKPYLALEDAESAKITLNGKEVKLDICGWYVDKSIKKVALPPIITGKNILEISLPFGANTNTEWCYLLGDFGVKIKGAKATLIPLPSRLKFGDITKQGLPFYGGELTYRLPFESNGKDAKVTVGDFAAAVLRARTSESKLIALAPYEAVLPTNEGETNLEITAYISRQNAFGPIHLKAAKKALISPRSYYPLKHENTKRYVLSPAGILSAPKIELQ